MKRKLRNAGRDKKFWGGLIAGAANLVGSLFGSKKNSDAQVEAAKMQADATLQSAKINADAIKEQTTRNVEMGEKTLAMQDKQYQDMKATTERNTVNNLLAHSQLSNEERNKMSRMTYAKKGAIVPKYSLRGSDSKLKVTDGGYLKTIGITPEGYTIKEAIGNDHEHYHTTPSGKRKSGVGLKLRNGSEIEVEGNQNSPVGELVVETPTDVIALSKHNLKGYNPAKDVLYNGQHPLVAANIQENIKDAYDIDDNDKAKCGTVKRLRCGGRKKALNGLFGDWTNNDWGNVASAGFNILGNLGGALFANNGADKAAHTLIDANNVSANYLVDAYDQMHGIDLSFINKDSYKAPHLIASVAPAYINRRPEIESIDRDTRRQIKNIRNNTISSAAANSKINTIVDNAQAQKDKIYASVDNEEQRYKQENLKTINAVNMKNAELEVESNKEYNNLMLEGLKFNANIDNAKLAGKAQVLANANTNNAQIMGNLKTAVAGNWGGFVNSLGQSIGNAISTISENHASYKDALSGADLTGRVDAAILNGSKNSIEFLENVYNSSSTPKELKDRIYPYISKSLAKKNNTIKINSLKNITPFDYVPNRGIWNNDTNVSFG